MEKNSGNNSLITVVVPLYNVGDFLPRFFESLNKQNFDNFSCLFVLDSSPDNTETILYKCIKDFPNLQCRVLRKPKREGLGKARDFALDSGLINSKYVIFIDADDVPQPDFLLKLVDKAEKAGADITFCGFRRIDEKTGKEISVEMVHNPETICSGDFSDIVCYFNPATWNKLMLVSTIGALRYVYKGGLCEDEMFYLQMIPRCKVLAFVNEPLYDYRIRGDSLASSIDEKVYGPVQEAYLDVKKKYESNPAFFAPYQDFLVASIFMRFAIGFTTRVCLSNRKHSNLIIRSSKTFLDSNFKGWRKNKYLSFSRCFKRGFKALNIWRCRLLYKLNLFPLFVFEYSAFTKLFKKDVKW